MRDAQAARDRDARASAESLRQAGFHVLAARELAGEVSRERLAAASGTRSAKLTIAQARISAEIAGRAALSRENQEAQAGRTETERQVLDAWDRYAVERGTWELPDGVRDARDWGWSA